MPSLICWFHSFRTPEWLKKMFSTITKSERNGPIFRFFTDLGDAGINSLNFYVDATIYLHFFCSAYVTYILLDFQMHFEQTTLKNMKFSNQHYLVSNVSNLSWHLSKTFQIIEISWAILFFEGGVTRMADQFVLEHPSHFVFSLHL